MNLIQLENELNGIGYKLDRSMDCKGIAKWLTGDNAGQSYPCITTGVKEIDTGKSAFDYTARRDSNFEVLQKMRYNGVSIKMLNGYVLEI